MPRVGEKRGAYTAARMRKAEAVTGQMRRTQIAVLRRQKKSWKQIAAETQVSQGVCQRIYRESITKVANMEEEVVRGIVLDAADNLPTEKHLATLNLKAKGYSNAEIAFLTGVSEEEARRRLEQALVSLEQEEVRSVEQARSLQMVRYERLLKAHFEQAEGGDLDSTKTVLSIMDSENKLLGTNAPQRVEVSERILSIALEFGLDPEDLSEAAADIAHKLMAKGGNS